MTVGEGDAGEAPSLQVYIALLLIPRDGGLPSTSCFLSACDVRSIHFRKCRRYPLGPNPASEFIAEVDCVASASGASGDPARQISSKAAIFRLKNSSPLWSHGMKPLLEKGVIGRASAAP